MAVTTKTFPELVQGMAAAVQSASAKLIDLSVGSILRALLEAVAAVVLWLQGLVLQLLATSRASTSTGSDLDSWMADYGFARLPAVATPGSVTFSRFTKTLPATVPVGATVQTANGLQRFAVVANTAHALWNGTGYTIPSGTASGTLPVLATVAGAAGNVAAGQVSQLATAVPGIDTVTNASPFTGGADAEADAAFRARFVLFLASLSKGTAAAIGEALTSVQQGVSYAIVENFAYDGTPRAGFFYVVVDDGSGAPSTAFLNACFAAVDAVRAESVGFAVFAPSLVTANIAAVVTVLAGYDATTVRAAVRTALLAHVTGLGLGETLRLTRLYQVAYDAIEGVGNVTGMTINGAAADLAATPKQIVRAGTVAVS